ncbi:hypothetical protein EYF80_044161 [Liparis tanakae]|uniref:Uncharacterized protein n=1 Tax=Liparis tanakae TaxID=230148 RepID=A0A4Z2FWL5_9TELE|nr:hypothetical protein EYF80_044161 [Liparis tanakae]
MLTDSLPKPPLPYTEHRDARGTGRGGGGGGGSVCQRTTVAIGQRDTFKGLILLGYCRNKALQREDPLPM